METYVSVMGEARRQRTLDIIMVVKGIVLR